MAALKVASILVCAATIILLSSANVCSAQSDEPIGGEWVYSFQDEYYGIAFSGHWTLYCEKISESPFGDESEVVEYRSLLYATGSGTSGGTEYEGTMIMSERIYVDADTSDTIGFVADQHVNMRFESYADTTESVYDERNVTEYTIPGGIGTEPDSITAGDSWSKTYTKVSNSSGYDDGAYFSEEVTWTETVEYTFIGYETVIVPAGTFQCAMVETSSPDGTLETSWYAPEVSAYAMIVDRYESGEVLTYELSSYDLQDDTSGGYQVEMGSDLFLAGIGSLVVATAVAAAYASRLPKGQNMPAIGDFETGYMTRDGTRLKIRPIGPDDERAWLDFVNGLSPDSSYHRFFMVMNGANHSDAVHYLNIDRNRRMAMVAVLPEANGEKIVAIARYEHIPGTKTAEFAIVVADAYQDRGIGTFLLNSLSRYAKERGMEVFLAEVLPDNERMMEVFRNSGIREESRLESGTRIVKLYL